MRGGATSNFNVGQRLTEALVQNLRTGYALFHIYCREMQANFGSVGGDADVVEKMKENWSELSEWPSVRPSIRATF